MVVHRGGARARGGGRGGGPGLLHVLERRRVRGGLRGGARGFASARRDATFAEVNATSVTGLSAGRWLSRCATRSAKKVTSSSRNNSRRLAVWSTTRREVARSGGLVSSRSTSPRVSWRRHHASPLSRRSRGSPSEETVLLPGLTQSEGSVASPSAAVTGLQLAEARVGGASAKRGVDGANASEERDIRNRRSR